MRLLSRKSVSLGVAITAMVVGVAFTGSCDDDDLDCPSFYIVSPPDQRDNVNDTMFEITAEPPSTESTPEPPNIDSNEPPEAPPAVSSGQRSEDGRAINNNAATSVPYCKSYGIDVSWIQNNPPISTGVYAFTATWGDIERVGVPRNRNTLIMQKTVRKGFTVQLWRLTTGEFQVNSPFYHPSDHPYEGIFTCPL